MPALADSTRPQLVASNSFLKSSVYSLLDSEALSSMIDIDMIDFFVIEKDQKGSQSDGYLGVDQ